MVDAVSSLEICLDSCVVLFRPRKRDKKNVSDIFEIIRTLFNLVVDEKPPPDKTSSCGGIICDSFPLGPLASKLIDSKFLAKLVSWGSTEEFYPISLKYFVLQNLLRNFDLLISQAKQNLLFSIAIFQPLLKLIDLCREFPEYVSENLSRLLYTLSVLLCRDPVLLEFSKQVSHDVARNEYFIFSQLVPLLHLQGIPGNNARDALLLILALSDRDAEVANYLTSTSDICPVLATGLSGYYSCLPKRIVPDGIDGYSASGQVRQSPETLHVRSAGWHRISRSEWSTCEPLVRFLQTLDFCNLAVRISHQSVRQYLLYYIYSGFLMSVLRSALNQKAIDEVIAAEAYLELFLCRLTEPALIGLFLRFIVASTAENGSVLSSLITRLAADSASPGEESYQMYTFVRLEMVTLSLFRTILNLNCEDIMFLLVFQYLKKLDIGRECPVDGKRRDAFHFSNSDNLLWLTSSERFLKLSFWCTSLNDSKGSSSLNESGTIKCVPSNRFAAHLLISHQLIDSRTRSTGVWSAEYQSPVPSLVPTTSSTDPPAVRFHSTPLRTLMASSLRIESDSRLQELSLIDRYKSESNIYQLSYCDDSDEELERENKKSVILRSPIDLKQVESPVDLESNEQEKSSLDVIRQFVADIDGTSTCDAVTLFTRLLEDGFPVESDDDIGATIPYPSVGQFTFDFLDYYLGKHAIPVVIVPQPSPKYESLAPVSNLEADYDFESLYGNELPELPYRPTFEECSSCHHSSCGLGPFLNCVLSLIGSMHKNSLYLNLILTDVVLILASFHQFPLADILLKCADVSLGKLTQTLYEVLVDLRREIEQHLAKIPNWCALVEQAMCFLHGRSQRNPEATLPSAIVVATRPYCATDDDLLAATTLLPSGVSTSERSRSSSVRPQTDHPSAPTRLPLPSHRSASATPRTAVLEPVVLPFWGGTEPLSQRQRLRRSSIDRLSHLFILDSPTPPCSVSHTSDSLPFAYSQFSSVDIRNVIFAYIVFNEFCLELAGLCCEHSVSTASVQPQFEKTMELERCLAEF
uniref:Protein FAM160A1 n=1 Tax=Echinococcus granulosus TaxID=6210 RepID=A0A068WY79_ECHGR|nr:protein FAM160A1 [Echinococcus granulosus]